jgi:hypothetical protein
MGNCCFLQPFWSAPTPLFSNETNDLEEAMSVVNTAPTTMLTSNRAATTITTTINDDPSTKTLSDDTATQYATACSSNSTAIMFSSLPRELFNFIATFSSVQDLLTLAQTSKSMHQTVCDVHRPCKDCGESIFQSVGLPMECAECMTERCAECHPYCEACWQPCCDHMQCSHCDSFICPDCSEIQSCQTCDRKVCDECLQVCSDCGTCHGQQCIRFCPCCNDPVCVDCNMEHLFERMTMVVRVGEDGNGNGIGIMIRMRQDDEDEESGNESSASDDGNLEIVD